MRFINGHHLRDLNTRTGPEHHNWSGDEVGYFGAHFRIYREKGKASEYGCVDCDKQALHWSYLDHTGYSISAEDYVPRCPTCHHRVDRG